ncbi:MAG: hypothetical protein ACYC01_13200, partial [Lutibacter sp.]
MSTSAEGPSSGYIYQFEIALWQLSKLEENQSISIESIDDVAKIDEKGTYIATIQAKHSISSTGLGKSFGNTSEDLWKTLNIWISNIKDGKLTYKNKFYANSNKKVPKNSLFEKISEKGKIDFDEFLNEIEIIKKSQKSKQKSKELIGGNAPSIKKTILRIENVLQHKIELKQIFENFELWDNQIEVKKLFFNQINLGGFSEEQKNTFYHFFLGWIQDKSKEFWLNGTEAIFSKFEFDIKFNSLRDIHLLNKLYFRTKEIFEENKLANPVLINKNRIFIKQIEDIDRFKKGEIIDDAITDFLYRDIEMLHLIKSNSPLTRDDFEKFEKKCNQKWKEISRKYITKSNINDYSISELNEIAIKIYDEIMTVIKIDFQDDFCFNDSNK